MGNIFGHSWDSIQRAQQGGTLREMGYMGVIDQLERASLLPAA